MSNGYVLPGNIASVHNVSFDDMFNKNAKFRFPPDRAGLIIALQSACKHYKAPADISTLEFLSTFSTEKIYYMLQTMLCDLARGARYGEIFIEEKSMDEQPPQNETDRAAPPQVTLDMTFAEAVELYQQILKSRDGLRMSLEDGSSALTGFFFGWLDAGLTKLAAAVPPEIKHTKSGGGEKPY